MAIEGGRVRWVVEASTERFQQALAEADKAAKSFGESVASNIKGLGGSFAQAETSLRQTQVVLNSMGQSLKQLGIGSAQAAIGSLGSTMVGMAQKGLSLGSTLEGNKLSFKALTGSAESSREVLTAVADFAAENPFQMLDVSNVAKKFVAMSVPAKDVAKHLNTVGKVSVASGASLEGIGHVFSQVAAQGKLMTQDMYQLVNQGVAIMPALQRVTGKSMDQIREDMSDGKISFEMMTKAMNSIVPDDMAKQLQLEMFNTIPRQLDRLKGSISTFATELVGINKKTGEKLENGLAQAYTNVLRELANGIRSPELLKAISQLGIAFAPLLNNVAKSLPAFFEKLTKGVKFLADNSKLAVPALGAFGLVMANLGSSLPVIGPVLSNISGGVKGLLGSFVALAKVNPLLATFIGFFTIGFVKAYKENEAFRKSIQSLFENIVKLGVRVTTAMQPIIDQFAKMAGSEATTNILLALVNALDLFTKVLNKIPTPVLTGLFTAFAGFKVVESAATNIKGIISSFKSLSKITEVATKATDQAKSGGAALGKADKIFSNINKGLFSLAAMAGVIALTAVALKFAYETIPADIGGLSAKLGVMAGVMTAMSALLFIVEKAKISTGSLFTLAGVAVVVAIAGVAMGVANYAIPADLGLLSAKLGVMAGVIVAMGGLALIAQKFEKQIVQGLLVINGASATLAIGAAAMWAANALIPDDIGLLAAKIGVMEGVIIVTALVAGIASKFAGQIIGGLFVIIAVAGTVAISALALKTANDLMPDDLGQFASKIAGMGIAIGAFGVLAGVIGALVSTGVGAIILGAGLVAILAICAAMVAMAVAMNTINANVPEDMSSVVDKVKSINDVVTKIGAMSTGNIFENLGKAIALEPVKKIAKDYAEISKALMTISMIPIIPQLVTEKVKLISKTIKHISASDQDSPALLMQTAVNNFIKAVDTAILGQVVKIYADIARNLQSIQDIQLIPETIKEKIDLIKGVVDMVSVEGQDWFAGIQGAINNWANASSVESAGKVINVYSQISDKLKAIQELQFNEEDIKNKVTSLGNIVTKVLNTSGDGGAFGAIKRFFTGGINEEQVDFAMKIIKKFKELGGVLADFPSLPKDINEKLNAVANKIRDTANLPDASRLVALEPQIDAGGRVFYKMAEIAKVLGWFPDASKTVGKIDHIKGAVEKIISIPDLSRVFEIEAQINSATGVVWKLAEIANILGWFPDVSKSKDKIDRAREAIEKINNINLTDASAKEHIVGMATSIVYKLAEFAGVTGWMPDATDAQREKVKRAVDAVYTSLQINQDVGDLANKEAIVARATSIIRKLAEFSSVAATVNPAANITEILKNLTNGINQVFTTLTTTVQNNAAAMTAAGMNLGTALGTGLSNSSAFIIAVWTNLFTLINANLVAQIVKATLSGQSYGQAFANGLLSQLPLIAQNGRHMQGAVWNALNGKKQDIYHMGRNYAIAFANGLNSNQGAFTQSGSWAIQGFINGALSRNVHSVGWQIAERFLSGLKERGRQGSPWKETKQSGAWASEGLAIGIAQGQKEVVNTAWNLADSVMEVFDSMNTTLTPSIAPEITGTSPDIMVGNSDGLSSRNVIIEQTNNNYTQFSIDQLSRDLEWQLRKV